MDAFRKAKRRFKERVSEQVLGTEKFSDPIFDSGLDRFNSWNYHLQRVKTAHLQYIASIEAQNAAAANLADELVAMHFSATQLRQQDTTGFSNLSTDKLLKQPVKKFALIQTKLNQTSQTQWYREAVVHHLQQQQENIPDILTRVRKRENAVLDFSAYKRKVEQSNSDTDLMKRMEREKKSKDARQKLDDQTKSLLHTFAELESKRPTDILEDICSVIALQLNSYRRNIEILEHELPHFKQVAFPYCQLSVVTNEQRLSKRRPSQAVQQNQSNLPNHSQNLSQNHSQNHSHSQSSETKTKDKLNPSMGFQRMEMVAAPTSIPGGRIRASTPSASSPPTTQSKTIPHVTAKQQQKETAPPLPTRRQKPIVIAPPPRPNKPRARTSTESSSFNNQQQQPVKKVPVVPVVPVTVTPPVAKPRMGTCSADFAAASGTELGMKKNEQVEILKQENNGWWFVKNKVGKTGWVPSTFL